MAGHRTRISTPQTAASVEASIRTLGFKPEHIRLLLVTHACVDHAGATARFKKLSGAKVAAMDRDFERLFDLGLNWDARWRLREISYRLCFSSPTRVSAFGSD